MSAADGPSVGDEPMEVLRSVRAVLQGHFQYASGRHGAIYVEKARLLEDPAAVQRLCGQIVEHFAEAQVEIVVGPTTGGVMLAYETARQMGLPTFFAERADAGGREFRRGFRFKPGQRTLVVDDVLTTGGSVLETIEAVRRGGGEPIGVGLIADRTGGTAHLGVPYFACMTLDIESYPPDACPLCEQELPLTIT